MLQDICGRIPYGVKCTYIGDNKFYIILGIYKNIIKLKCCDNNQIIEENLVNNINSFKLCLRHLSSITEKEKIELKKLIAEDLKNKVEYATIGHGLLLDGLYKFGSLCQLNWLNMNHFDYRDLIEIGLAEQVPKCVYK